MSAASASMRALLVDVDGVLITGTRFMAVLAEQYDIYPQQTDSFFGGAFVRCQLGLADLADELPPALAEWGWPGTFQAFLDEWFQTESTVDGHLLSIIQRLRATGTSCYLATMQERRRMGYLMYTVGLGEQFDGAFPTFVVGYPKSDTRYFKRVLAALNAAAHEVMFVDDLPANVDAALACGVRSVLYQDATSLEQELLPYLDRDSH